MTQPDILRDEKLSFSIRTFGCKVNTYDTGLLQKRLQASGYLSTKSDRPRIHILNTCAVTAEATKEAVRSIRRIKSKDPFATVVVTGCAAQVDTESFLNLPGADLIIANSHKGQLEDLLKKFFRGELKERVFHSNIFKKDDLEGGGGVEEGHTRAFLKIQDGCNSFCTYCVIPFARGKSRSLSIRDLISRIRELESSGVQEVVLTGVHIGDYEDISDSKKYGLEDLLESILAHTKISRIRLTSLEPVEVTERLLDLYSNPRMCRHFHMSIQSATSSVLALMHRKYGATDVETALASISHRVPGAYIGMDVIVGFPGETNAGFEETFERLCANPWTRMHVFPYSERPGTKATKYLDKVPASQIHRRAARLRELSQERYTEQALAQIGTVKRALLLKKPAHGAEGLTRDYWPVQVLNLVEYVPGCEILVKIIGFDHSHANRINAPLVAEITG